MKTSVPPALNVLITLTKDEYPEVSEYCINAIKTYFDNATVDTRIKTLDSLCENFFVALSSLPRIMNNIGEYFID